jgi:hypothetical protein
MSDKVKLTKEQAEVLETLKKTWSDTEIVAEHANEDEYWSGSSLPLNEIDLDTLIKSLYIGYEIIQTPEKQMLDSFETYMGYDGDYGGSVEEINAFQAGMITVLDIIKMKVAGINAPK